MFCTIYKEKILLFQCKFDLEGEDQGHWFSNSSEILVETISIPNLMQIAEELEKLSRSQEITQTTTPDDDRRRTTTDQKQYVSPSGGET